MGLEVLTEAHGVVGSLSDGKDMRWDLVPPLTTVDTDGPHGVDGEPLVRVDSDTEETGVGVDQSLNVPLLQIEQDGGVVEVSQVRHVLAAVVLGRVDLSDKILLVLLSLSFKGSLNDLDSDFGTIGLLNDALSKLLLRVRDIARSLGIVGLFGDLLLDLVRDKKIWSRVWVRLIGLELDFSSGHVDLVGALGRHTVSDRSFIKKILL